MRETHTGTRKRFRRPATSAPSISSDQEVSASVNRFKVTRNRISNKNKKNEIQTDKSEDYKVGMLIYALSHIPMVQKNSALIHAVPCDTIHNRLTETRISE